MTHTLPQYAGGERVAAARGAAPAWSEASPAGVFDMLFAPGTMGAALADHPGVGGVSFTGSRRSSYGARAQGFAAVEFYTQTKTAYSWA